MPQHFSPTQLETATVQLKRGITAEIPLTSVALLGTTIKWYQAN